MSMLWMWFQFRFYVINKAEQIALFQNPLHISCCLSLMASNSPHKLLSLLIISFGEHIVEGGGVKGRKMIILSHKYSRKLSEPKKTWLGRSFFVCLGLFNTFHYVYENVAVSFSSVIIWVKIIRPSSKTGFVVSYFSSSPFRSEAVQASTATRETYQKINKALFFRSYFCATFIGNCSEMYKKKNITESRVEEMLKWAEKSMKSLCLSERSLQCWRLQL